MCPYFAPPAAHHHALRGSGESTRHCHATQNAAQSRSDEGALSAAWRTRFAVRKPSCGISARGLSLRTAFIAPLNISFGGCTTGAPRRLPVITDGDCVAAGTRAACCVDSRSKSASATDRARCIAFCTAEPVLLRRVTHVAQSRRHSPASRLPCLDCRASNIACTCTPGAFHRTARCSALHKPLQRQVLIRTEPTAGSQAQQRASRRRKARQLCTPRLPFGNALHHFTAKGQAVAESVLAPCRL